MSEREELVKRLREQAARANRTALKDSPSEAELRGVIGGMYIVIKDAIAALAAPQPDGVVVPREPTISCHCFNPRDKELCLDKHRCYTITAAKEQK